MATGPAPGRGHSEGDCMLCHANPDPWPGMDVAQVRLRGSRKRPGQTRSVSPRPVTGWRPGNNAHIEKCKQIHSGLHPALLLSRATSVSLVRTRASRPGLVEREPTAVVAWSPPTSSLSLLLHLVHTPKFIWAHGCLVRGELGVAM